MNYFATTYLKKYFTNSITESPYSVNWLTFNMLTFFEKCRTDPFSVFLIERFNNTLNLYLSDGSMKPSSFMLFAKRNDQIQCESV